jgi:hypothetical protein
MHTIQAFNNITIFRDAALNMSPNMVIRDISLGQKLLIIQEMLPNCPFTFLNTWMAFRTETTELMRHDGGADKRSVMSGTHAVEPNVTTFP